MLLHRKQKKTNTLLQDVSRAASRIAEESKGLAEVAKAELGDVGREVRGQASGTAVQARRAAAARLASAAETVEPGKKRRGRRLPVLLPFLLGGLAVARRMARRRGSVDDVEPAAESAPSDAAPSRSGAPGANAKTEAAGSRS